MEKISIVQNRISFELDKNNLTATIVYSPKARGDIIIPSNIIFQNNIYKITTIDKKSFKNNKSIKSIKFSADSNLLSFKKSIFNQTRITSICIPASVETLEEGWCKRADYLKTATISSGNRHFKYSDTDERIIIGKSDKNSAIYDTLVFANRDIDRVKVPDYISRIDSFAFFNCKELTSIEISENSMLKTIGKNAFSFSPITHINIPPNVEELEEGWCSSASYLQTVTISPKNRHFKYADKERKIVIGKSDKNSDVYDVLVFACRDIEHATIPDCITRVSSNAFMSCRSLTKVEISENSNLKSIGMHAFSSTAISSLYIPASFERFEEQWSNFTMSLTNVIISPKNRHFKYADKEHKIIIGKSDKNSEIFDVLVFACRDIEQVTIPEYIVHISSCAFGHCKKLLSFKVHEKCQLRTIGSRTFSNVPFRSFTLPKSVEKVGCLAFYFCDKLEEFTIESGSRLSSIPSKMLEFCRILRKVTVPDDSQLRSIDQLFFPFTQVQSFNIPPLVEVLDDDWCKFSLSIKKVTLSPGNRNFKYSDESHQIVLRKSDINSEVFDVLVFANRNIEKAVIPSYVKFISPEAFDRCNDIEYIEIPENSELVSFDSQSFSKCSIHEIFIPSKFEDFKDGWCRESDKLQRLILAPDNPYFKYADEEENVIIGKSDNNNEQFDVIVFANRNIENVIIPSYIKYIKSYAFYCCSSLGNVEFQSESSLESIGESSFAKSAIRRITIPKNVETIARYAFSDCPFLEFFKAEPGSKLERLSHGLFCNCRSIEKVDFPDDSSLRIIETRALNYSAVKEIYIPRNVEIIQDNWYDSAKRLTKVVISPKNNNFKYVDNENKMIVAKSDSNSDIYDSLIFAYNDLKSIIVPESVTKVRINIGDVKKLTCFEFYGDSIQSDCFRNCENLLVVSLPNICPQKLNVVYMRYWCPDVSFFFANVKL